MTRIHCSVEGASTASPRSGQIDTTAAILSVLHPPTLNHNTPHSPSGNASLADSSITTEVALVPSVALTQQPASVVKAVETSCSVSHHSPSSQSSYQPRTLKDLVKRDLRSSHASTVQRALQQITLDCWDDPSARSMVARVGGILNICTILEEFAGYPPVLVAACQALEKLALDADNELAITEIGGLDLLWKIATTHTESSVIEAAWAALQNCTCQLQEWDTDMQVWVKVLQQTTIPVVAAYASAATANLCVSSLARARAFGQAGGMVAMAQALEQHWHDQDARTDLAQSLARVCESIEKLS